MRARHLLIWIAFFAPALAKAEYGQNTSRFGIQVEALALSPNFAKGALFGVHSSQYFLGGFNVGFGMISGTPNGQRIENDNLTYGGLTLGYDTVMNKVFHFEAEFLSGYGFGSYGASFAVRPSIGAGVVAVDGWRVVFVVSYLHFQSMPTSGLTFTLKFDRKTSGSVFGNLN